MLLELKVSQFAIIENIQIPFRQGLNILSGETGAGKSVLLKSLALLMGGKASSDMIRSGYDQAIVEGYFDLSQRKDIQNHIHEMGIEIDEQKLIVRRIISSGDKSRVYLNGCLSTLSHLRDIVAPLIEVTGHSAPLIEMTGQHDNRHLMSKSFHLDLIDQYSGCWDIRNDYQKKFNRMIEIKKEIEDRQKSALQKAQRLDFLIYQRDEIAQLNLSPTQDLDLENSVKRLKNSNRIRQFVDLAESALYHDDESAMSRINFVVKKAQELSHFDSDLSSKVASLEQARSIIDDAIYELRQYAHKIDADPSKLEELESRLSNIRKLQKKYGSTIEQILLNYDQIEAEIKELQNSDVAIENLKKELNKIQNELNKLSQELHTRRTEAAFLLANGVNDELSDLNMKGVIFHIQVEKLADLNSTGISDVEFLTQTSAKDNKRPLAKFASGGELSRILLSLKRIVGSGHQPRTYLFDEVDTGVSGETAEKVGKKLKSIAKNQQVICVTHLPQVAAHGDVHFFIQKLSTHGQAEMEVVELKQKNRIQEIARLISGEKITKTSLAHAEELLHQTK